VGKDAFGYDAPALDIEKICRACGVNRIYSFDTKDHDSSLTDLFKTALNSAELSLVIVLM